MHPHLNLISFSSLILCFYFGKHWTNYLTS